MEFITFINNLSEEDRENYNKYSPIRGPQMYRIIFETLSKKNSNVTYKDVNSFVRNDKAIKDILYKYLGSLEETIKTYILNSYDFIDCSKVSNESYKYFKNIPSGSIELKEIKDGEITCLYRLFSLNFGEIITFLKEFKDNKYDYDKLESVRILRNKVMHHTPLLFNCECNSIAAENRKLVLSLIDLLPRNYDEFIKKDINHIINKTKNNIQEVFYEFLMEVF